jgi:signal transduction histidine kinase
VRKTHVTLLEDRAARLEADRVEETRKAAADERARIARELHDVVAHHVSVIAVQAGAARLLAESERRGVASSLGLIETTARQALAELRRLLGVLRKDTDGARALAPQPRPEDLDALVSNVREAGVSAELVVTGDQAVVPAGVHLQGYRIVQEALTNVLKHGGAAHVRVMLRYEPTALEVSVTDDGRGPAESFSSDHSRGHGLIGMRERVNLVGGELRTGARNGGGFEVVARLPFESAKP